MSAKQVKKPVTKLKVAKKKKMNKWLIIGGVAAVALVGIVVVRLSSASTWVLTKYIKGPWTVTTSGITIPYYNTTKGRTYRVCFTAYTSKGTSEVTLSTGAGGVERKYIGTREAKYCDSFKENSNASSNYVVRKKSGNNVTVTAFSTEQLR